MGSSAMLKPTFALRADFDDLDDTMDMSMDDFNALRQSNLDAWNSPTVRDLLAQRKYTLDAFQAERTDDSECPPSYPSNPLPQPTPEISRDIDPYPFGYLSPPLTNFNSRNIDSFTAVTVAGRNAQGQPIVVKAFDSKGEEGAIYRHLRKEPPYFLREGCMLPILDIIDFDDKVSFAVMPMWNSEVSGRGSKTIGEMSVFIHSLLKATAYMHRNRIVHRDIRHTNYAVNYRAPSGPGVPDDPVLLRMRKERKVRVACFDFDVSKMYPRETDLASARLPWWSSVTNESGPTPELEQGELEYNPFALEVARLGYHFLRYYREAILDVPTLAPLISMMTDWDLSRRFTAQDALTFYEGYCMPRINELWDKDCQVFHNDPTKHTTYEEFYDPWYMATPFFRKQWPNHQPRPMPLLRRLLRKICQWDYGLLTVRRLRSFWRTLSRVGTFKASLVGIYSNIFLVKSAQ